MVESKMQSKMTFANDFVLIYDKGEAIEKVRQHLQISNEDVNVYRRGKMLAS